MVDSNTHPSMGFIVGEFLKVKAMKAAHNNIEDYKLIVDIIDDKAKDWLDSPLHTAPWFLNPLYSMQRRIHQGTVQLQRCPFLIISFLYR